MRPEKFHYEMTRAFDEWFHTNTVAGFNKPLLREMKRVWAKMAATEKDNRSGPETYGYLSRSKIYFDMMYISDRWRCAFRLKWLIDGIEGGHFEGLEK